MEAFNFETDDVITSNTFNPEVLYQSFTIEVMQASSDPIKVATIFFKRMKSIKDKMKQVTMRNIPMKFFDVEVTVVNTYNNTFGDPAIGDSDYTLNRLSGCLARFVFESYTSGNAAQRLMILGSVKNPLAIVKGVRTENFKLYMAFSAGAEMFLDTFGLLPLAITLRRVEADDAPASVLHKVLKQRLDGMPAVEWQKPATVSKLKDAMAAVAGLSWKHSKLSDESVDFLKKAGVAAQTLAKIKRGGD
ncbi:nucleocapsid protein N [Rio Preto da Eva virus]|uniref:Nucleoprotein n=1 Tax=Rio Preto da Eva virus TaxID=1538455 RepID=A0A088NCN4_9VIRU|nr:nucleocapsid protein N [Rio Preto da Eva virus]AIN55746.1 nucleocapsid protein N [Rio Preto da Eva virus]